MVGIEATAVTLIFLDLFSTAMYQHYQPNLIIR